MSVAVICLPPRWFGLREERLRSVHKSLPPLTLAIPMVIASWALVFEAGRFADLVRTQPANTDFRVFYLAARSGSTWGWPEMYDPSHLAALNTSFGAGGSAIGPLYTYVNPPLLAWLIAPLTVLPFSLELVLWAALNVAAIAAACRLVFGGNRYVWGVAVLGSLAVWPTAFALERGQPELLLYAFVVASWWFAKRGSERAAGAMLGVAACLRPQDMILLPAVFVICGYRRTALWFVAVTAVAAALFAAVLGPTGVGTYMAVTVWAASDPNFTAAPFLSQLGTRESLLVGQMFFAALTLVAVLLNRRSLSLALAIGIVGTLTSAVHLHEYDYVGLAVAAWLAYDSSASVSDLVWIAAGVVCAQLPAIGIRTAILVWQPLWLVFLASRERLFPAIRRWRGANPSPQAVPA